MIWLRVSTCCFSTEANYAWAERPCGTVKALGIPPFKGKLLAVTNPASSLARWAPPITLA